MSPNNHPRATGVRLCLSLCIGILFSLVLLNGCGSQDEKSGESVVLVTVGDTDITADAYVKGLTKMEIKDLPLDEQGQPVDTATIAGKQEFLKVLINKELMRQKAMQLGYDKDPEAVGARTSLMSYHAGTALWESVVGDPANSISEEELQAFYDNMGKVRPCRFLITNFIEDAQKARDLAESGADWDDVVAQYHDGSPDPKGKYQIKVPFGQYSSYFEDKIYAAEIGGVTEPILTSYGYWVLQVLEEKQGDRPDLETAKAQILDVTRNRKLGRARNEFKEEMREQYKLHIDEDVLWICYQGIPEGGIMNPETNEPRAKDTLEPLDVPLDKLGEVFYSYEMDGEVKESTLGDYKIHFDKMSVFQRPKRSDMLGGLRESITKELERPLVNAEAKRLGFFDDPEVLAAVNGKVEEMIVTKLYGDVVQFDERVSFEDLSSYYNEHKAEFFVPETRLGRLVVCLNEAQALEAKAAATGGMAWPDILKQFGNDRQNKSRGGKLDSVSARATGPVKESLFGLEVGQVGDPFPIENGRFAVVILDSIKPEYQKEQSEVNEIMGSRIKNQRKEDAFQALLEKWSNEFGVTRFDENLAALPTWEDLRQTDQELKRVPRNL